ncbi:hypothetical protein [Bradyrhizobium sp. CCBAU 11357]|uniref:hypothetical protein n=1 Tax=Bradyrhizobium sp. CCBAU 11357 TaxID=1630808 RepID=UPI00230375CF|nr:hypothetical protein [Bradyrhizobium sp. CCBAU 11357]
MTQSLTYVEIDLSICSLTYGVAPCTASIPTTGDAKCFNSVKTCQDRAHFSASEVTLRFAKPAEYLPREIDCIPSILSVEFSPATVSLGKNLGQRASLTITFRDHPHSDTGQGYDKYRTERAYDPYSQGTYWGKFRARQPFLRGRSLRWISGVVGQDLADMERRHFVVDSFDGPTPDGKYTIIAKDVLKFADGDRAQAPALSNGYLSADITAVTTSIAILPSGIGNAEYPTGGTDYLCIGGNEIVQLTSRVGNTLTVVRGQLGTTATTHKAQDRVQRVLRYSGQDVANIAYDLMVNYAGVPASYINLAEWQAETAAYLGTVYTATICEPTSVATLLSELAEQAGLAIWDDNVAQKVRLKVLHGVLTDANTFTPDNTLEKSLTLKEQPDQRLSRVQVYFGQKDPTKPLSNLDNYRSTSLIIDEDAEADYGSPAIRVIYSRWIPEAGRTVADRLGEILIGRFRDPPRRVTFATARYAETDVELGQGYRVESVCVQDAAGAQSNIPIQTTRVNPGPDRFTVEAEEMLWSAPDQDLSNRQIVFDANTFNVNLRTAHDSIYPAPQAGDIVTATINAGVIIGSTSTALPAFDVGSWPAGVTIAIVVNGLVQGMGGTGGVGGNGAANPNNPTSGGNGSPGGRAFYTRQAVALDASGGGKIWSGGGGGGGGGGAGTNGGSGGVGGNNAGLATPGGPGSPGSSASGGAAGPGGSLSGSVAGSAGGSGGGPGLAGNGGSGGGLAGAGGAAGTAIDGISFITLTLGAGDIRGPQIN